MQQISKKNHPFRWMMTLLLATVLFFACNNEGTKSDKPAVDPTTETKPEGGNQNAAPPVDTTTATKPEGANQ